MTADQNQVNFLYEYIVFLLRLLQYHLYAVALHRYLLLRKAGYEYAPHFGGVYYMFVRGVDPQNGPAYGIHYDRPAYELITSLSNYLT